ncbi:hypothetical protein [Spongiibacter sp. UBA1325]|uniref:hypothetical protein n=1 Tax=Spongiibacter sp. UBA1325 TaxID=1947543 RepID=UPI00257BA82A|nr:hypothetical protein [Spongiibacter sp. UBA1325]|tara:strand:+ start:496 stop:738 length:243 start_codon:yes stop_codon:yes gene_type:complete
MRITNADAAKEFTMSGGSFAMAFKANGGTLKVEVMVDEGEYVTAKTYSDDAVDVADFGRAVCRFVVTGAGKLNIYGGINA